MRTIFLLFCICVIFMFSACGVDTSGASYELTSQKWASELEGGGKVNLRFDNDFAILEIKSKDDSITIKGRYVVDNNSFVIFVPEVSSNYLFDYESKGETLKLSYNDSVIILKQQ